jgi:DNA mismatch repair protein MutS
VDHAEMSDTLSPQTEPAAEPAPRARPKRQSGTGSSADPTPMMRQYLAAKRAHPDALLFFRMGDFYELFFDDAILAADLLGLTLTTRDKRAGIPMAGVPWHAADGYVARLVRAGRRVAICDQVEDAKLAKGLVERRVTELVSPGTAIHGNLVEERANNFLAAAAPGPGGVWGVALADASTGEFLAGEFPESALADELVGFPVAELLVPEGVVPVPALLAREVGTSAAPLVTLRPGPSFDPGRAAARLAAHFGTVALDGFDVADLEAGIGAAGALLEYLTEMRMSPLRHLIAIRRLRAQSALMVDENTLMHLDVLPPRGESPRGTLLGVLDSTRTAMGGRLLRRWLARPGADLEQIGRRLRAVGVLATADRERARLRDALRAIGDLERLASRIESGRGGGRELRAIADSMRRVPELVLALDAARGLASPDGARDGPEAPAAEPDLLAELSRDLDPMEEIAARIDRELVPEPPLAITDGGIFREGVYPELDQIRAGAQSGKEWIAGLEASERSRTGIGNLRVAFNRVFGYYIEVTRSNLKAVPADYMRKQTLVGAERFITPDLKEMEAKVLGAEERMARLEHGLFLELREAVAREVPRLLRTAQAIAVLDTLGSFAETARAQGYVAPELTQSGPLVVVDGRHPVVEALVPGEPFVPNDTRVGEDGAGILILTGPNMAGKSTYLRQVGLIVLMAHAGSFVPARAASIPLTDRIFTRVGASDRIARGQSTFLVEMEETAVIVRSATARSLVLLDEVGRGTSTYDGLSIAWAVVEYLHDRPGGAPRTLFATHYHELTRLSHELPQVKNLNVAVAEQGNEVRFLRKIVEGAADRSYGIHVAQLAGLPAAITERARAVLKVLEEGDRELGAPAAQLSLFPPTRGVTAGEAGASLPGSRTMGEVLGELRDLELDRLTPLEALSTLVTWQSRLERETAEDAGVSDPPAAPPPPVRPSP